MTIIKKSFLASSVVLLLVFMAFAGNTPDYNCAKAARECTEVCDKNAESGKNANAYQKCLDGCSKAEEICNGRQEKTSECAETFQSCIKNAKSENDKQGCRTAYTKCKGN